MTPIRRRRRAIVKASSAEVAITSTPCSPAWRVASMTTAKESAAGGIRTTVATGLASAVRAAIDTSSVPGTGNRSTPIGRSGGSIGIDRIGDAVRRSDAGLPHHRCAAQRDRESSSRGGPNPVTFEMFLIRSSSVDGSTSIPVIQPRSWRP
jgi:hypothetical protein